MQRRARTYTNEKYVLLYQYLQGGMTVDDKIRQVKETFPCMSGNRIKVENEMRGKR